MVREDVCHAMALWLHMAPKVGHDAPRQGNAQIHMHTLFVVVVAPGQIFYAKNIQKPCI